jgi:hypothetical protein
MRPAACLHGGNIAAMAPGRIPEYAVLLLSHLFTCSTIRLF